MLTDNDIKRITEDSLSYNALSETLEEIILTSETPLTIGLYGEWGSGKTSLMQMTRDLLSDDDNIKTAWFDAWKFDKSPDLRVALIQSILREIEQDRAIETNFKEKVSEIRKKINWFGLGMNVINQFLPRPITSKEVHDPLIKEEHISQKTLELIGDFEEEFKEITKEYVGNNGKLVIFIDDLDRCIPEKAIDILEAIKLFLNVQNSIFIIGADKKVIESGIHQKYPQMFENWGKDYLDKIVQIPFFLPPVRDEVIIGKFIPGLNISEDIKKYKSVIAGVGGNPRTIKRLLNQFQLQKILAKKQELDVNNEIMAKFMVIQFRQPEFYENFVGMYINSNLNLVQDLKRISEYDDAKQNEKLEELKYLRGCFENCLDDNKFMEFLHERPLLEDVKLDDYIYLVKSTTDLSDKNLDPLSIGNTLLEKGDYIEAINNFDKALKITPEDPDIWNSKAQCYMELDDLETANFCCDKSIKIDPYNINVLLNKGRIQNELENHKLALSYYDRVLDLDHLNSDARNGKDRTLRLINKDKRNKNAKKPRKGLRLIVDTYLEKQKKI